MTMTRCTRFFAALVLLLVLVSSLACSPKTPPAAAPSDEASTRRLREAMQLNDEMALDVLRVLKSLGCEGEVYFAYAATDDEENTYYRVRMGEDAADVYISPRGAVTAVRMAGRLQYESDTPPDIPSERVPLALVSLTETVERGGTARVELTAEAGEEYRIEVHYKSGISTARGLEARLAAPNGRLFWEWTVSSRVSAGDYRIRVLRVSDESDALELSFCVTAPP